VAARNSQATWREVFSNLSPWGYTKLLASLVLLAAVLSWGVGRWAYLNGLTLHSEEMETQTKEYFASRNESLENEIVRLDQKYDLSVLQRRKARKIYSRYYVKHSDEWAKMMISQDTSESYRFWASLMEQCDQEFQTILSKKQMLKGRPR